MKKILKISIMMTAFILIGCIYKLNKPGSLLVVDIHGSTKVSAKAIINRHRLEFNKIANIMHSKSGLNGSGNDVLIASILTKLDKSIKNENKLKFVHVSPVIYPKDSHTYITIDVLDPSSESSQLPYLAKPTQTINDPHHLIENWLAYEKKGFAYFYRENKFPSYQSCPAHHCLFGFEQEPFKKYASIFNANVEKDKLELMNVLRFDKDTEKRAAAAFLLAHMKNIDELISLILPSMYDADAHVRNNVMRVLGFVLLNNPGVNFQINKMANILDFPLSTDRNKALFILLGLSSRKEMALDITQYFGKKLLIELKQLQPNNHNLSYAILKNISGKQYAERDYASWTLWVESRHVSNA